MNNEDFELLECYLDGQLSEKDVPRLRQLLIDSSEARSTLRTLATLDLGLHDFAASQNQSNETQTVPPGRTNFNSFGGTFAKSLLALASLAILGLGTALWFQVSRVPDAAVADRNVAKVTGIGGAVVWTGNGGSVTTDLQVGAQLTGGTIEGTNTTSWVELEFLDGSRVTVAGDSQLTFSDLGQKVLHLKKGSVTSSVEPQSPDAPMLVHTRTAMLEVLGTEFEVASKVDTTALNVTQGKVRLQRLSDGQTVEVPANQRVLASEGLKLSPQPIPDFTSQWKSRLNQPDGVFGKWLPASDSAPPRVKLVHYRHTTPQGETFNINNGGVTVSGKDNERVVLRNDSRIRIRGFAHRSQKAVFGVVVRDSDGGFGGYFSSFKPENYWMDISSSIRENDQPNGNLLPFEIEIKSSDLKLSPNLEQSRQDFAESPIGSTIAAFVCSTPPEDAGIEVSEVEIFLSDTD